MLVICCGVFNIVQRIAKHSFYKTLTYPHLLPPPSPSNRGVNVDASTDDTASAQFSGATLMALIVIGFVICMTGVLVLCVKYECYRALAAYLGQCKNKLPPYSWATSSPRPSIAYARGHLAGAL